MTSMDIRTDLERAPWTDLENVVPLEARLVGVGLLRHGTTDGRAVAVLRIEFPDPETSEKVTLLVQTTWRLLRASVRALAASPTAAEEDPG